MDANSSTRKLIIEHYKTYPKLQIQDILKFLFQSCFGCEHMISSLDSVTDMILKEAAAVKQQYDLPVEKLDGSYSRVHLSYLKKGLSAFTLSKLFCASARKETDGLDNLKTKIYVVRDLIQERLLPFSVEDFDRIVNKWSENGYPAIHHSDTFRNEYWPSYRVIADKYIPFLALFADIDRMLNSCSAVITSEDIYNEALLTEILLEIYNCKIINMEEISFNSEKSSNKPDDSFHQEIYKALNENKAVSYPEYNCSLFRFESAAFKTNSLIFVAGFHLISKKQI